MATSLKLLLVEDSEDDAELLLRNLSQASYEVICQRVVNGLELRQALSTGTWDLVIADYSLPQYSGMDALADVRRIDPSIPFILLSGTVEESIAVAAMKAGAHDYVMKGNLKRLIPAIERELRDAESRAAHLETQRILQEREERIRLLTRNTSDVLWAASVAPGPELWIKYISPSCKQIFGHEESSFYLNPGLWTELVHPEDRPILLSAISQVLESGSSAQISYRISASEQLAWVETSIDCTRGDRGAMTGLHGVVRDITERKRAEVVLAETQAQLLHAQKMEAIGRLAGGVAHDFNNLLAVILLYCESMMETLESGDDASRKGLRQIQQAAEKATGLTRQLLAFGRKEGARFEQLNINSAVLEVREMISRLLGGDIRLKTDLSSELWSTWMDRNHLVQVLLNLAINARDAMTYGGDLTFTTSNTVVTETLRGMSGQVEPGQYVMLCVEDTGHGMPRETLARIFEPFFTTKGQGKGTGLGLSVIYGILQESSARILVDSAPQQGTRFRIFLPKLEASQAGHEAARGTAPFASIPAEAEGKTILLVEDNTALRSVLVERLKEAGYQVMVAGDSSEALELANKNPGFDLLLTDVVMPGRDGPELTAILRKKNPELRALFMSGDISEAAAQRGFRVKDENFIQKPFSTLALLEKIARALASKPAP